MKASIMLAPLSKLAPLLCMMPLPSAFSLQIH
jgi:hypothetical protein